MSDLDPAQKRLLPWLVAIAFFMQTLDTTILNTALPAMARGLGESPLRMQAVIIAYALTVALFIPASGYLSDRFGARSVFLSAIVLFSLGSLACALSSSLALLTLSRVLQGVGGALLLPVGRLAILKSFPKGELLRALAFVTIPGLIGPLVGPVLGGIIVETIGWHWIFLINLPVGLAGAVAAQRYMPELKETPAPFDWVGFFLFGAGMVAVSFSLQAIGERALSVAASLLLLGAGLATMTAFWLHAGRTARPLFRQQLFSIHSYAVGILGNLFARLGAGAMPFLTPLFLQVGLGYAPSEAGLFMVPSVLGAMGSKAIVERLVELIGYRNMLVSNTLLLGVLIASFALVDPGVSHVLLALQLFVFGGINSLQFTAMNTLTLSDLQGPTAGEGNALLSVVMQLAMSLGVAAAGALLLELAPTPTAAAQADLILAFHRTYLCVGALSALAAIIFAQLRPEDGANLRRATRTAPLAAPDP